jgi:polyribonucleotide nucleotidyltransferase
MNLLKALTIAGKQERETKLDEINKIAVRKFHGAQFEGREKEVPAALPFIN